jgi:hypothetical protein
MQLARELHVLTECLNVTVDVLCCCCCRSDVWSICLLVHCRHCC